MRSLAFFGLALALLSIEAVVVKSLGLDVARIDVTVALVVYLGLRGSALEGAFTSFAIGYLLDVFTGRPTWLFPFLAVLTFLLVRAAGQVVDGRSRLAFSGFVAAATLGHAFGAFLLTLLTAQSTGGHVASLSGLPLQVLLTTLTAALLWPLLKKIEPGERPEPGVLR